MTMIGITQSLEDNDRPALACLQLYLFDLAVRAQVARRRIGGADAALLYAQTTVIRAALGCGGNPP